MPTEGLSQQFRQSCAVPTAWSRGRRCVTQSLDVSWGGQNWKPLGQGANTRDTIVSCRAGEYCVVINGALGCCPEGFVLIHQAENGQYADRNEYSKVCDSVRTCTDHSNPGCKNGGTVGGSLCWLVTPAIPIPEFSSLTADKYSGANTPYCNSIGYTDYCDTVPPPAITKTATLTTTVCPHSNYTVTPSCPSPPANHTTPCASAPANHTTTYILPTLAPYPSDEESEATPTPTYIAHTSIYVSTSTNRTTSVPKPTVPPIQTGGGDTINVSFSVAMGGCAVALLGAFLG